MMEKAMDVAWLRQKVATNNIANVETPNYKAKTVQFKTILNDKCKCVYHTPPQPDDEYEFATYITEESNTNQILTENNVDMEKEQLTLLDAQYQYKALSQKINKEFQMLRTAIRKS